MKRCWLCLVLGLMIGLTGVSVWAASPLLTPDQLVRDLAAQPARWRVLDIRDGFSYNDQHLPGAVNLPFSTWRGPDHNAGSLPSVTQLLQLMQSLKLSADQGVVVVSYGSDANDFGAAARVYWTLKYMGVKRLGLLTGGQSQWELDGQPTQTGPAQGLPEPIKPFVPQLQTHLLATTPGVLQHVQHRDAQLVDARTLPFFQGLTRVPTAKAAGTLPDAVLLDSTQWFDAQYPAMPNPARVAQWGRQHPAPKGETVVFCNTGLLAAINWFVLSELLDWERVKLYPGSMVEWTQQVQALPVANEPSRWQRLWMDAKMWFEQRF